MSGGEPVVFDHVKQHVHDHHRVVRLRPQHETWIGHISERERRVRMPFAQSVDRLRDQLDAIDASCTHRPPDVDPEPGAGADVEDRQIAEIAAAVRVQEPHHIPAADLVQPSVEAFRES